jgi:N6-L-threonylcarbamoyladenine synthase
VINRLHNAEQKGEEVNKADLCASFQHTVTEMLVGNTMKAAADLGATTIVLAGGVSANSGLRAGMEAACKERGYGLYAPPLSLCGDNGAMVAAQGYYELLSGHTAGMELNAIASLPITEQ